MRVSNAKNCIYHSYMKRWMTFAASSEKASLVHKHHVWWTSYVTVGWLHQEPFVDFLGKNGGPAYYLKWLYKYFFCCTDFDYKSAKKKKKNAKSFYFYNNHLAIASSYYITLCILNSKLNSDPLKYLRNRIYVVLNLKPI